jgi:hypothetical protein
MTYSVLSENKLEKSKAKRKIIAVDPISEIAQERFEFYMDSLHSCYIDDEINENLYLTSVNKKYKFVMNKKNDKNWKLVK